MEEAAEAVAEEAVEVAEADVHHHHHRTLIAYRFLLIAPGS